MRKKLIKLSKDHYVIVDDSEIKEGDYILEDIGGTVFGPYEEGDIVENPKKIITSTQPLKNVAEISLLDVERVIYGHDIDKLATDYAESDFQSDIESDPLYLTGLYYGYVEGFRTHRELSITNKDVYDLADSIRKAYLKHGKDSWLSIARDVVEGDKQTTWTVEYENGELKLL